MKDAWDYLQGKVILLRIEIAPIDPRINKESSVERRELGTAKVSLPPAYTAWVTNDKGSLRRDSFRGSQLTPGSVNISRVSRWTYFYQSVCTRKQYYLEVVTMAPCISLGAVESSAVGK